MGIGREYAKLRLCLGVFPPGPSPAKSVSLNATDTTGRAAFGASRLSLVVR